MLANSLTFIFLIFLMADLTTGCDIIIRVKSSTNTSFRVKITTPNGKSDEKLLQNKGDRFIFQEKAKNCGLGLFQITTYSTGQIQVTLTGIGSVNYEVRDDLVPKQISRQGAECKGECAPLASTKNPKIATKVSMKL
ncbi:unnamed protein product [Thelazia callipaeda]|uniref:NTR domain-containing protein n=1 Tax=Thelazia callipaeda TaxID=103827 RepID=A0A0N5D9P5_THECL|nr:unnamed protein product [Thelazia callipaeda]